MIRRTRQPSPASSKIASAKSAQVQSPSAGDVPETVWKLVVHEAAHRRRQMTGEGRTAALVVDDRDLVALCAESEHRPEEVVLRRAEEPRRPDHPRRPPGGRLAVELRPPVRRYGIRPVRLDVRRALATVEHIVGRERHERRAQRRGVRGARDVHRRRALRIGFGAVDVRPGSRVQNEIEAPLVTLRHPAGGSRPSPRASARRRRRLRRPAGARGRAGRPHP